MSPVPGFIGSCPTSSRVQVYLLRWDMTGRLREGQPIKVRVIPAPPKKQHHGFRVAIEEKVYEHESQGHLPPHP